MKNIFKTFFNSTHTEAPASPQKLFSFTNTIRTACSALLLAAATFVGAGEAWAQTYTASSGNAGAGADGRTDTRWESDRSDPQWWMADYGTSQTFTSIEIVWEGAYANDFNLLASDDGETWTTLKEVRNQKLSGFPNTQKYIFNDEMTFRYVKFQGIKRGTQYGYSFWEFRLIYEPHTYSASSQNENIAANGADGNENTRWESEHGDASQWWQVDYQNPRTFDQINILWNECYARDLQILATNEPAVAAQNPTGDGWTTLASFSDLDLPKDGVRATQQINLEESVSYRYVRVLGTERAPAGDTNYYGYSFYEFNAKSTAPRVAKMTVNGANELYASQKTTFSTTAVDQFGNAITPNVTYSVSPAEAGTFDGNEFTALLEGDAVITATDATGVVATLNISIVGYNPQIRYLTLTSNKYSVAEGENFVLSLKGVDQYGDEYEITEADHDISFAVKPQGYVERVSGFNFRATDSGKAKITVTASPKAAPSAHRAPGFVDATLSDDVTITVTSTTPHILKDYKSFQFVHTQGAKYWLDGYGNFDGTYYYSPTKETRHYIDSEYLRYGIPDMTTQKESLPDPRILPYAAGNGNYYIENGSAIQAGNVRQRTHWMEHIVWAKPGEEIYLYPFSDFATQTNYLEKYMRWYDYSTDKAAEGLSFDKRHYYSPDFGVISGSGWLGNDRNNYATVAVYTAPDSYNTTADQHIYIACDLGQTGAKSKSVLIDPNNLWGKFDVPQSFVWQGSGNDANVSHTQEGTDHFFAFKAPREEWWNGENFNHYKFVVDPLPLKVGVDYQFSCDIADAVNVKCVTVKLTQDYNDNNTVFQQDVYVDASGNATFNWTGTNGMTADDKRPVLRFWVQPVTAGQPASFTVSNIKLIDPTAPDAGAPYYTTGKFTIDENNERIYEPLIHGRQLFNIRPAGYIADQLSNHNADYISSVRRKISARANERFNVRLDYEMPVAMTTKSPLYYMNGGNVEHIYGYKIHTYKKDGTEISNIFVGDDDRFTEYKYSAIMTGVDGNKYYRGIKCEAENAAVGVYVVKIIGCDVSGNELFTSGGAPLEIMEYEVTFLDAKEASFLTEWEEAKLAKEDSETYGNHTETYLRNRAKDDYSEAATVTFDTYDDTQFRPHMFPADYAGEYYKWPVIWKGCTYMYGYDIQRRDAGGGYDGNDFNMYMLTKHSATFACKSAANAYDDHLYAEVMGIEPRQTDRGLHDRTFYSTGGETVGNFFAVNASSDPGRMVDAQIDDLCLGSTLYVSAWVAELSNKNSWGDGANDFEYCNETANLIFNFNAVTTQGAKIPLHSFTTGYVDRGNGYSEYMDKLHGNEYGSIKTTDWNAGIHQGTGQQGEWLHVYYTFVPDASHLSEEQIANIAYYELSLENNCVSSDGADYAIDDVRVFISRPQVIAEQLKPVCSGEKETDVKVSANFESMLSSLGKTEAVGDAEGEWVYFYYTFLDNDKYYGEGHPTNPKDRFDQAVLDYKYLTTVSDDNITVDTNNDQRFGIAKFNTRFDKNISYIAHPESGSEVTWGDHDKYDNRYIVFNTHPTDGKLYPGKEYIISLYAPANGEMHHDTGEWDENMYVYFPVDDKCAKRCVFRVHSSGVVKVNGKIVTDEDDILVCDNQYPVVQIDAFGFDTDSKKVLTEPIELQAPFDWYGGSMKEYLAEKRTIDGEEVSLAKAISAYRTEYPVLDFSSDQASYGDPSLPAKGTYTEGMRQYLIDMTTATADKAAKLALYQRSFTMAPGKLTDASGRQACYLVAIPVEPSHYIINGAERDDILICTDPSEIRVYIDAHSPHMLHGFPKDITYPESMDDVPLRVGLDQLDLRTRASLDNLKAVTEAYATGNATAAATAEQEIINARSEDHGLVLNIPIRKVTPTQETLTTLRRFSVNDADFLPEDVVIYLSETNDPEYARLPLDADDKVIVPYRYDEGTDEGGNPYKHEIDDEFYLPQVGVLLGLQAVKDGTENMMRMAFRDDFRFKEGYYYRLLIKYTEDYPAEYVGEKTECDGQLVFTLKIVPKYQKWVGGSSTDFNNDANWRRITSDELHHDLTANDPKANKLTDGYAASDDTKDHGYANTYSYVPMDFTDVLIPSTDFFPRMYDVDTNAKRVEVYEGGEEFTDLPSGTGYLWPNGSNETGTHAMHVTATPLIEYDMAAWSSDKGVNCRPWYANRVEHITFLTDGEMYAQQYLHYQRAWVELKIAKDRWYTLTSPLKKTVSGDMYAPTLGAQQLTEHFLPITFDPKLNDRFRPAVYQRAWDHSNEEAKIYRKPNDGMPTSIENAYVAGTWSHVYNDNKEIFTDGRGFSVKADVSRNPDAASISNVLFRLPKDDATYQYHDLVEYDRNGQTATDADPTRNPDERYYGQDDIATIDRKLSPNDNDGFFADGVPNQARLNDVEGTITVTTANSGKYFLVGNPFMSHLDMDEFFNGNPGIERKYWIVSADRQDVVIMGDENHPADEVATGGTNSVAPMQAFFVEATTAANTLELKYKPEMQKNFDVYIVNVDGGYVPGTVNPNVNTDAGGSIRPGLQMPARRSTTAPAGQLRIHLSDPSEQESASDSAPRLVSTAVVALRPLASANYEESEDAILLLDSNLDEQAAIYTVAGETAVSINCLERINTVPLGTICDDDEAAKKMLTLTFSGADNFAQTLYLYNAATDEATLITDDFSMLIPARSTGQYFITTGLEEIEEEISAAGPVYNLKGIRVANTRNERILIQDGRKSIAH